VPSKLNPADAATRGLEVHKVVSNGWLQGPSFLLQPQSLCPNSELVTDDSSSEFLPVKSQTVQTVVVTEHPAATVNQLINHYSNFNKL